MVKKNTPHKGKVSALKTGETKGSQVNNWLRKTGVLAEIEAQKPEETGDYVKDVIAMGKWVQYKKQQLRDFLEIYSSVGGTAANYMTLIKELEFDLLSLKKSIEDRGEVPLENSDYQKNLKLLQGMILEANKLNLDVGKAMADYKFKKANNPDIDDDDLFTVQEED